MLLGMDGNNAIIDMFPCTMGVDMFPCCADIHGIVSTHVECVIKMQYCGFKEK